MIITSKRPNKVDPNVQLGEEPLNYRSTTTQVQNMILSMNNEYMTMNEIMTRMGFKHRTSFREKYFLPSLEEGAIELLYTDQPNHPRQKYRLTKVALEWKQSINFD